METLNFFLTTKIGLREKVALSTIGYDLKNPIVISHSHFGGFNKSI